jgi:DNA-binding MarR family transcriptional regulator
MREIDAKMLDSGSPPKAGTLPGTARGRRINSSTEQIRQAAAALGTYTLKQIRELGFTERQVSVGNDTLVRQGRAKRTGYGSYCFIPERQNPREAPIEERIWHAMRINPSWSCSDIAVQAGTTVSYVYKRLREYRAENFVKRFGRRNAQRGPERLWKLTAKGRERLTRPDVQIFEPKREAVLIARLVKLVSTGAAFRFPEENTAAIAACRELAGILEGCLPNDE